MRTWPSYAGDCEAVIRLLNDRDKATIDDISRATKLATFTINDILTDLRFRGLVAHLPERIKGKGKVNFYALKIKGPR